MEEYDFEGDPCFMKVALQALAVACFGCSFEQFGQGWQQVVAQRPQAASNPAERRRAEEFYFRSIIARAKDATESSAALVEPQNEAEEEEEEEIERLSFAEVSQRLVQGLPLPCRKVIVESVPAGQAPSESRLTRPAKPWETSLQAHTPPA
eukprot:m.50135 g.50135  ORF g.50135 m.50135 type:complete len:151 (-) comp6519_c0_seq1:229-681(-)